jgi:RNA polymerase sigma-70 factor (ECF subfamily)
LLYRRKTGRQRALVDRYAQRKARPAADGSVSPLAWILRAERQRIVQAAIARLPQRDAVVLILKYAEGLSAREIAERQGVAVATIETRLHRARSRLRAELSAQAGEIDATDHE